MTAPNPNGPRASNRQTTAQRDRAAAEKLKQDAASHNELMRSLFGPAKQQHGELTK